MKEITRIHLAKIAYDIELDAKKDIQAYIAALERYAGDPELLVDIEIRITELLSERGVPAGGVIAKDDVAAVRTQLGEPSDFAPEGEVVAAIDTDAMSARKLYRDRDSAVFGGVLAGIGRFFGIDPLWTRLIFIVVLIASFGLATIVYLLLWLIVPPARTAAERLQMLGRPVTLESIKELGEHEVPERATTLVLRRVLRSGVGVVLIIAAIGALTAAVAVPTDFIFGTALYDLPVAGWGEAWWFVAALSLFVLAGLLLSTLCFILADATFRRRWSRRIGVAVVVIVTTGLLAFFSGVGTAWYGVWHSDRLVNDLRTTSYVNLPAGFSDVKSLVVGGGAPEGYTYANITYTVSDTPRYELSSLPGLKPRFEMENNNKTASLELVMTSEDRPQWRGGQVELRVYGPALDTITVRGGSVHYYNATQQDALTVVGETDSFSLSGTYKEVNVISKGSAGISLDNAAIEVLEADITGGYVRAGVVRKLAVTQPDVCAVRHYSDDDQTRLQVQAVSSERLTYNGSERPASTIRHDCGSVVVGSDDGIED